MTVLANVKRSQYYDTFDKCNCNVMITFAKPAIIKVLANVMKDQYCKKKRFCKYLKCNEEQVL